MSSIEEVDALALAQLEEDYAAAGEPAEIDDAFADRYFQSIAAASGEKVNPRPGRAQASFLKESQAFVDVKFDAADLKFATLQTGGWPFPGMGAVIGNVVPGQTGKYVVKHVNKAVLIRIRDDGKPWEGGWFIGVSWSGSSIQSGTGTWEKL